MKEQDLIGATVLLVYQMSDYAPDEKYVRGPIVLQLPDGSTWELRAEPDGDFKLVPWQSFVLVPWYPKKVKR